MSEPIPDDLISTKTAARLSGNCSLGTVHRWILRGRLGGWRIGNRVFVSRAELMALWQRVQAREPLPLVPKPVKAIRPETLEILRRFKAV